MILALSIIICYLIGSIPFGYIFGKVLKGIDIRKYGSGNIGATNALRNLGKLPGAVVLFLDALKGLICVSLVAHFFFKMDIAFREDIYLYLLGLAAVAGHNWTIFLGFRGGKGVATTLGILLGISLYIPEFKIVLLILIAIWFLITLFTKIVSLASLIAAISLPATSLIYYLLDKLNIYAVYFSLVACLLIIIRHRSNIIDLLEKKERKLTL